MNEIFRFQLTYQAFHLAETALKAREKTFFAKNPSVSTDYIWVNHDWID